MDNKIKLFAVASAVAVLATGCSGYRANQGVVGNGGYSSGGGTSQIARTGQMFGQRRAATTCAPCAANAQPKSTYTYTPAPKPAYTAPAPKPAYTPAPRTAYRPAPRPAGQHNQQYYIDKWNREQAQQKKSQGGTYAGYGNENYNANVGASNTTYYDYSSAGKAKTNNNTGSVSTSNKSIYTGSYQQKTYKPYQPTTYSGGSSATTNTNTTYVGSSSSSGGGNGSTYTVKKGDTVFEIMRQTGVYWKDIIKLNNLQAPAYNINPGQIIRLK